MKPRAARLVAYSLVVVLGAAAVHFTPQLPESTPGEVLQQGDATGGVVSTLRQQFDTLASGESLQSLFIRGGVPDSEASAALLAATATDALDERRIPAGLPVIISAPDSTAAPTEIILQLAVDRLLHIRKVDSVWVSTEERIPWTTDTVVVNGVIASTLYEAMDSSAKQLLPVTARRQLTWGLADIYEYRVDMSRDLQVGDHFRVMAERSVAANGAVRIGNILAATFTLSGTPLQAIRFESKKANGDYFDQEGKSLRAAFLRAPLEFRRISSVFGRRYHPILKQWKTHTGTDYAANAGTPVRAIGDGVVVRAGRAGGYGNLIEIRHPNGFVTRYGHLRAFAKGIHSGARVTIGSTIGYVGQTGLATGPHLHFEVIVDGRQRDPRVALRAKGGQPIPSGERAQFLAVRDRLMATLASAGDGTTRLASR